jgi:transcriptional accessory protein Tex/SPT6
MSEQEVLQAEAAAEDAAVEDATGRDHTLTDDTVTVTDDSGRVVKMLSVGQQVEGKVKRLTEFGAFVDIGVGRDGLVHVSELSTARVAKVGDVLQEGQEVTLWIKKLDRERNRISLTMIEPGRTTIRDLQKGEIVTGTVTRILPYGAFVDIGIGRDALLRVREMGNRYVAKPEDVVQVGQTVEARIIEIARRRSRIDLSLKGLIEEPEPEPEPAAAAAPEPERAEELVDTFADVEVLTPMQLAFMKAQERSGVTLPTKATRKTDKRSQSPKNRSTQDEIIARTLSSQGKG